MTEKKNPDEKKKRGRKSEYQKEYADQALKLCLLGPDVGQTGAH